MGGTMYFASALFVLLPTVAGAQEKLFTAPGATLEKLWSEGEFTEGPAAGPDGRVYFSDIRYVGNETRELPTESVYRIDPDGTVTRVTTDVRKPNGLVIAPDGKTLYVSDHAGVPTGLRQLVAFPLSPDGSVGAKR